MATVEAFEKNPQYVHRFYNELKPDLLEAKPNLAHLCLTKLQTKYNGNVDIVTQNVDTLHEKAGSKNVYHMHGKIDEAICLNCGHILKSDDDVGIPSFCFSWNFCLFCSATLHWSAAVSSPHLRMEEG